MMSIEVIRSESRRAAAIAAEEGMVPFVVEPEDIEDMPSFPFPSLGDYVPEGWEKVNEYFVDASGFGEDDEAALSVRQFKALLVPGHGYAVTESGQFQVYVGEYIRT